MHRGMCSGAGNRVFRAAERLIRACNPFEASPSRLWSLLTLIPQRIRRAVTAAAAACYTYTLAQFLAMVCLLLASAFVQLTMKVRGCGQGGREMPKRLCAHARNRGIGERIWSAYAPPEGSRRCWRCDVRVFRALSCGDFGSGSCRSPPNRRQNCLCVSI